jgi:DNA-binding Xre family transcriptional regulator
MIVYSPLWKTMKERQITTYYLINKCGFSSSTISKMKHNKGISTATVNDLCNILNCGVSDVMLHIPDDNPYRSINKDKMRCNADEQL